METIDVSLPEPMKRWIESRIESGLYADASDYVRDLIRHDRHEALGDWAGERMDALIAEGMADLEAGRVFDADEVFDEMEATIREVERQKNTP